MILYKFLIIIGAVITARENHESQATFDSYVVVIKRIIKKYIISGFSKGLAGRREGKVWEGRGGGVLQGS